MASRKCLKKRPGTDHRVTLGINPNAHQSNCNPTGTATSSAHTHCVGCYKVKMSHGGSNEFGMMGVRSPFSDFCNRSGRTKPTRSPNPRVLARGPRPVKNQRREGFEGLTLSSTTPWNRTSVSRPVLGKSPYGATSRDRR